MESGSTVNTVDNNSLPSFGRKDDSRLATVRLARAELGVPRPRSRSAMERSLVPVHYARLRMPRQT